jgi:preprotein translocase subunit SecY
MTFLAIPQSNPIYRILSLNGTYQGVPYGLILYIVMTFLFTYFYTFIQVDPEKISGNFGKSGAYIPGIRPGKETEQYLTKVLLRLTTIGAFFLTTVSALPMLLSMYSTLPSSIAFGGTGLIIVVGVISETSKEIDGRLAAKEYQGFIG